MVVSEGNTPLRSPSRAVRQTIHLKTPCCECLHSGLCAIEEQIEENLVLEIVEIGRVVALSLSCSEFEAAGHSMRPRIAWTDARRARFTATMALKRVNGR